MAAIVVRGGAVISKAANLHRMDCHAERRTLRPHVDYTGADLYVVRSNLGISKPCPECMKVIVESGVKNVFYFNKEKQIEKMRL